MNAFQKIKQAVSIYDVVSGYTTLKKAGSYLKGHCPFHSERTASFTISPDRGIFYCFGCNAGGDVIAFIAAIEHCTQKEAVHLLAERFDIPLETESFSSEQLNNKKRYQATCTFLAQWCQKQLLKNKKATEYLSNRKIQSKALSRFLIGYMPPRQTGVSSLIAQARTQGLLLDDLLHTGFLQKNRGGVFSPYEDRIIFPIQDSLGRFCGFGGRTHRSQDTRPKYYNTPENSYFIKSELLFGLALARDEIQKTGTVFLVEGYTDCISMYNHGYINTVATLGTACTKEHLQLLSRYAKRVHILYDGDNAGIQAVLRLAQLCWATALDLFVATLPKGSDPAAYLEKNQHLQPILDSSQDIFSFYLAQQAIQFSELALSDKLHRVRQAITLIAHLQDPLKRGLLISSASSAFKIPQDLLHQECRRLIQAEKKAHTAATSKDEPKSTHPQETDEADKKNTHASRFAQRAFLAILHDVSLYNNAEKGVISYFLDAHASKLLDKLEEMVQKHGEDKAFTYFFSSLHNTEQQAISRALLEHKPLTTDQFQPLLTQLKQAYQKQQIALLKRKLAQVPADDTATMRALLQKMVSLGKTMANVDNADGVGT